MLNIISILIVERNRRILDGTKPDIITTRNSEPKEEEYKETMATLE